MVALANSQFIDNVEVSDDAGRQDIKINFTIPIRYISHTPSQQGKILQIFFQKVIAAEIDSHEEIRWPRSLELPVEDIHLEEDTAGNPTLLLSFNRQVQFEVIMSADLRSLTVSIKNGGSASIAPQLQQPGRPNTPPAKQAKEIAYTVTLRSSTKPFPQTEFQIPAGFEKYKIYSARFLKNGAPIHRLRLGYFDTEKQARNALEKLKEQYPAAWIAIVAKGENLEQPYYAINLDSAAKYALSSLRKQDGQLEKLLPMGPEWSLTLPSDFQTKKTIPRDTGLESNLYQLYVTQFKTDDGRLSNRLRLGFFSNKDQAEEALSLLKKFYPQAWVTKVTAKEKIQSAGQSLATARYQPTSIVAVIDSTKKEPLIPKINAVKFKSLSIEQIADLLAEAEKEMTAGNFRRSIQIYTKILEDPENKSRKTALELLAFARERNGQLAQAKAEYEKFIELYPEDEETPRVRQRLAGLVTARATPKAKLKKTASAYPVQVYGSVSQYYYYDETTYDKTTTKPETTVVNRSSLSSNMDFNIRKRTENYEIRTLAVGGNETDLEDSSNNENRLTYLYVDAADKKHNISGRFGRQSKSTGGVLGRFDGGQLSYNLTPKIKVTGVGGFTVNSTDIDEYDTHKSFYGMSLDFGTFAKYWDVSPYAIQQEIDGLTDRQAIGGEIRFFHPNVNFFALTDYDIYFDELNTILFTGNINFPSKTMLNMMADYRNSPILSINNALQSHTSYGYTEITDVALLYSEEELKEIAINRTARSQTYMLGIVQPINDKLQISADATASKLSALDAYTTSTAVSLEADPGTDYDYYYSMQIISSSLFKEGDIAIIGLNYTDASAHETYSASLNTRYPLSRSWRINPRVRVDWRENKRDGAKQFKVKPLLNIDFSILKPRARFEVELGGEWVDNKLPTATEKTSGYFATVGYRLDY